MHRALKQAFFGLSRAVGVNRALRRAYRRRLVVVCYHGVVPDDATGHPRLRGRTVGATELETELEILRRRFHPVSVGDLA